MDPPRVWTSMFERGAHVLNEHTVDGPLIGPGFSDNATHDLRGSLSIGYAPSRPILLGEYRTASEACSTTRLLGRRSPPSRISSARRLRVPAHTEFSKEVKVR